jgi:hypothetical protein
VLVFGVAGCLDPPRDRQVGFGADGGVQLVAVEPATFAGGDRGPVSPRRVGVSVVLAGFPVGQFRIPLA